jgi:hypothetical protein
LHRRLARLEQPLTALEGLRGTVAIDEISHRSDLFPILSLLTANAACTLSNSR